MSDRCSGACQCGALRFEVTLPTRWALHCHCTLCRRTHGAPVVTWVGVENSRFTIVEDATLRWFASTPGAERGFCGRCGSTLFFRSERWPDEIHIVRTAFEGAIDREPSGNVHTTDRAHWFPFEDHLEQYPETSGERTS